jgi:rubrerythrin
MTLSDIDDSEFYCCPVCGFEGHSDLFGERCPKCGANLDEFEGEPAPDPILLPSPPFIE